MIPRPVPGYTWPGPSLGCRMRRPLAAAVFLIVVASGALAGAADFPYGSTLAFKVLRNGKEIGQHTVAFRSEGAKRIVQTTVDLSVKALGVVAYRYQHSAHEVWNGPALESLETRTDDNGTRYIVRARRESNGLVVDREVTQPVLASASGDQGLRLPEVARELLPGGTLPTSNWNMGQLKESMLLNTQYGTPAKTRITPMGRETVKTASGATIEATRYHYAGDLRMDQWFDSRGRWVKAAFPAFDGSVVEYLLQE